MVSKFILTVLMCLFSLPTYADVLIPLNLFAEKSKDTLKENVFVWNNKQYSCDSPTAVYFKTEAEANDMCTLCPNREVKQVSGGDEYGHIEINGKIYYSCKTGDCLKCNNEGQCVHDEVKDVYACALKSIKDCPPDKPQLDTFGFCHPCEEEKGIDVSWLKIKRKDQEEFIPEEGFVCDNRKLISVGSEGERDFYSVLNICPSDRPLQDYVGNCHSCDETKAILVRTGRLMFHGYYCYKNSCTNINEDKDCSNREFAQFGQLFSSVFSIMKKCPADKPLRDENGGCHSFNGPKKVMPFIFNEPEEITPLIPVFLVLFLFLLLEPFMKIIRSKTPKEAKKWIFISVWPLWILCAFLLYVLFFSFPNMVDYRRFYNTIIDYHNKMIINYYNLLQIIIHFYKLLVLLSLIIAFILSIVCYIWHKERLKALLFSFLLWGILLVALYPIEQYLDFLLNQH